MARKINRHIIHCSATPYGRDVTAADIDRWHREKGWSEIGYHFVVRLDGAIEGGRSLEKIGAHVKGHNADSIGTCLIGPGADIGNFYEEQLRALRYLHRSLEEAFAGLSLHAHREYSSKDCPGFDIEELVKYWEEL